MLEPAPDGIVSRLVAVFLILACSASALEVEIHFSAIQRIMAEQVFTDEGKLYVKGSAKTKCSFAFLEKPSVSADGPRLMINAKFSGRSARNLFGRCIGLGDSFDIRITAVPYYKTGMIALREVKVESPGRDGMYIRRVRAVMADSLTRQFSYNVAADAKRMLEDKRPGASWSQELRKFDITSIRMTPEAVIVTMDVTLSVK